MDVAHERFQAPVHAASLMLQLMHQGRLGKAKAGRCGLCPGLASWQGGAPEVRSGLELLPRMMRHCGRSQGREQANNSSVAFFTVKRILPGTEL